MESCASHKRPGCPSILSIGFEDARLAMVSGEEKKSVDLVEEEQGDEEAGEDEEAVGAAGDDPAKKKKKRKKKKKKNAKGDSGGDIKIGDIREPSLKPPALGLKETAFTDFYVKYGQTEPPTIPVADLFKGRDFPHGEIQSYDGESQSYRHSSEEVRGRDRLQEDLYTKLRHGAEVHRQVRAYAQSFIKPGIKLADMCERLENKNRELVGEKGLERGVGFPTGCSINHVAAHYTPNVGDETVLNYDDVMKVDFGVQIDGRIVDCAWTVSFNPRYDPLLQSVREATDTGIRASGIDARLCEIGASIQEVMESYEVELDGKTYPIKAIRNLNGKQNSSQGADSGTDDFPSVAHFPSLSNSIQAIQLLSIVFTVASRSR
jgi:methionyl aminopeptidase